MAGKEELTESRLASVVSDTTALTTLLKCGLDWLLPEMFGRILIPVEVARELLAFHSALPDWCLVRSVPEVESLERLRDFLDAGEAEAIALAVSENATTILLDDKQARREAVELGLVCLGLPDLLTAARLGGLIPSLKSAFAVLAKRGRYRVREATALPLLESVGEE